MSLLKEMKDRRNSRRELEREREQQILESKRYPAFSNKKKVALIIIIVDIISILIFLWFLFYVLKI